MNKQNCWVFSREVMTLLKSWSEFAQNLFRVVPVETLTPIQEIAQ